jgi:DNA repair protein RadC
MNVTPKEGERPILAGLDDTLVLLEYMFSGLDREHFVAILLGPDSSLIGINTISIGSVTTAVVHPREVFKPAILGNAVAILLAHNHPFGDFEPSELDINTTEVLRNAGDILQIRVVDHIVWSRTGHFSFADNIWRLASLNQEDQI